MPLKGITPNARLAQRINNYFPDLIILLDKPEADEEFFADIKAPCIWLDHHKPQNPKGVEYLNPRLVKKENNLPTSLLAYYIAGQDEWIAATGIVADWQLPPTIIWDRLNEEHPDYLPTNITTPEEALYHSKIGILARIFSFNLKGKIDDVITAMKILTRIKNPEELLEEQHAQAKRVMKTYHRRLKEYTTIINSVEINKEDPVLTFTYGDEKSSYTPDISNELLFGHPEKLIIIARNSRQSYKCSLRSSKLPVEKLLQRTLEQTEGTGGGHEHACGAVIPNETFSEFVKIMRIEVNKYLKEQEENNKE